MSLSRFSNNTSCIKFLNVSARKSALSVYVAKEGMGKKMMFVMIGHFYIRYEPPDINRFSNEHEKVNFFQLSIKIGYFRLAKYELE